MSDSFDSGAGRFNKIPPKRTVPAVSIVLDCTGSGAPEISAIVSDLLASTFHDFRVYFTNCAQYENKIVEYLKEDDRFLLSRLWPGFDDGSEFVVYLPAGYRLIRYSLEAMVEALNARSTNVLRILSTGSTTGPEAWRAEFVREAGSVQAAERIARQSRTEWWVCADSVGIWPEGALVPKPFVRRGSAGEHVLVVHVHSSRNDAVKGRRNTGVAPALRRRAGRLIRVLGLSAAGPTRQSGSSKGPHTSERVEGTITKLRAH